MSQDVTATKELQINSVDDLFAWLVVAIASMKPQDPDKEAFIEVVRRLRELYLQGYEDGQADEHGESRKPLGY